MILTNHGFSYIVIPSLIFQYSRILLISNSSLCCVENRVGLSSNQLNIGAFFLPSILHSISFSLSSRLNTQTNLWFWQGITCTNSFSRISHGTFLSEKSMYCFSVSSICEICVSISGSISVSWSNCKSCIL